MFITYCIEMHQFQVTSDFVFFLKYRSSIVWKDIRLREKKIKFGTQTLIKSDSFRGTKSRQLPSHLLCGKF